MSKFDDLLNEIATLYENYMISVENRHELIKDYMSAANFDGISNVNIENTLMLNVMKDLADIYGRNINLKDEPDNHVPA